MQLDLNKKKRIVGTLPGILLLLLLLGDKSSIKIHTCLCIITRILEISRSLKKLCLQCFVFKYFKIVIVLLCQRKLVIVMSHHGIMMRINMSSDSR